MDFKTAVAVLAASAGLLAAASQTSAQVGGDPCTEPPPRGLDPTRKISLGKKTLLDIAKPVIVAKYGVVVRPGGHPQDLALMRALYNETALALRVLSTKQGIAYRAVNGPDDAKMAEVSEALIELEAEIDSLCP
jgi:hypothetical protein